MLLVWHEVLWLICSSFKAADERSLRTCCWCCVERHAADIWRLSRLSSWRLVVTQVTSEHHRNNSRKLQCHVSLTVDEFMSASDCCRDSVEESHWLLTTLKLATNTTYAAVFLLAMTITNTDCVCPWRDGQAESPWWYACVESPILVLEKYLSLKWKLNIKEFPLLVLVRMPCDVLVLVCCAVMILFWRSGNIEKKLSLCYSIVYYYNGAQKYKQFLQVGWLYRALILLGSSLSKHLLISAAIEASNFKFGIQVEFGNSLPRNNFYD